jgi:Uma2 family endonuclease
MTAKTELENQILLLDKAEEAEEIYYFYDIEENYRKLRQERGDMPNAKHNDLVDYLKQVLLWLYRLEKYQVNREINFYETNNPVEEPLYPDIFVVKTTKDFPSERGYRIGLDGPAPEVIIEIVSKKTASVDLEEKPKRYEAWGVAEYFVYDPRPRKRNTKKPRLSGWRLVNGKYQVLQGDELGRIWSQELDSWLVPEGEVVRLYDKDWNPRLTKAEAEEKEKEAALQREAALRQQLEQMAEKLRQLERQQDNS